MYATDFIYDGEYLSDYGFIICEFDYSSGATFVNAGATISFNTISMNHGKKYSLASTKYEECIGAVFDICKDPDTQTDRTVSEFEYEQLIRWLNRNEFLRMQFRTGERKRCYYDASFNIEKIIIGGILYGLRLTMVTNRPFGYGDTRTWEFEVTSSDITNDTVYKLEDISEEIGCLYPTVELICYARGELIISNQTFEWSTIINNCTPNLQLKMDGENQTILILNGSHDNLWNDFNYKFFKIGNTYKNRINKIKVSLPCKIKISYNPIIKRVP